MRSAPGERDPQGKHSNAPRHSQNPLEADLRTTEVAIACDRTCDSAETLLL